MSGREAAAEALARVLRPLVGAHADIVTNHLLAAIECGDIPGLGVLPESETLTEAERTFIGSSALLTALYETVLAHPHMFEPDGPDGPYVWCVDGWRSDDHGGPGGAATAWAVHLSNALHAEAVKALRPLVERKAARPASVDAETLRQVADELADWTFPDPDETQPHSAYRVALLERLYRYVGLLRSRADLPDREPDGLRAQAQAWDEGWRAGRGRGPGHTDACPIGGTRGDNPYRALLAHPATDQDEADRG